MDVATWIYTGICIHIFTPLPVYTDIYDGYTHVATGLHECTYVIMYMYICIVYKNKIKQKKHNIG